MGMSKTSKQMPCIRHRSRASSTSFSGKCRAKFGRKLKNLSETTADDKDNAGEDTPRNAPAWGVDEGVPPPRSTYAQGFWITERVASRLSGLTGVSAIFWRLSVANRRFKFKKRSQLFLRSHNETFSVVAVRVSNPDRSPVGINRSNTAPTPSGP
jgi:hypothetical protein